MKHVSNHGAPGVGCVALVLSGFGSGLSGRSRRGAQQLEPVPLLPLRRLTPAIQPIVSRASRASENGDDVGCGVVGNRLGERHGSNRNGKRKIGNAENTTCESRHCRHNSGAMKAKQYTLTLTQEEAEAVGFALKRASRELEKTKDNDDTYWESFRRALRSAYENLDTCPMKEVEA